MIDAERVRDALVEALPAAAPVTAIDPIPQGFSNESFVVDCGLGRVVAKVALPDVEPEKYEASGRGLAVAHRAGLLVPEQLAFVGRCERLDGRIFRVLRHIEGETPRVDVPLPLFEQLGAELRKLHAIGAAEFTSRFGGPGFARFSAFLEQRWPGVVARSEAADLDMGLVRRARAISDELAVAVDAVATPVLCHRDLYLDNVLVDGSGALAAVIDFDNLEVWDPMVEWFVLDWFVFDRYEGSRDPFMLGYLAGDPSPPMFEERVRLSTIIELVNHVANWRLRGDDEVTEEAMARLPLLLSG